MDGNNSFLQSGIQIDIINLVICIISHARFLSFIVWEAIRMKKQYFTPDMEVISLKREDMILTSAGCEETAPPPTFYCPCDATGTDYHGCYCHGTPGEEK